MTLALHSPYKRNEGLISQLHTLDKGPSSMISPTTSALSASVKSAQDPKETKETEKTENTDKTADTSATPAATDDFMAFMTKALGGSGKTSISEEELFAAVIGQRLGKASEEAAAFYDEQKALLSKSMARGDGYVSWEDVAKAALLKTVEAGKLDRAAADMINGEAFAAAQLDTNTDALYDDRGGPGDETMATAPTAQALGALKTLIEKLESKELTFESRSLDIPSNGKPSLGHGADAGLLGETGYNPAAEVAEGDMDGSGGFVYKPVSDSDGKLAVLIPSKFAGDVERLELHTEFPPTEQSRVAKGRYVGETNGDRPTFRFDKPGEGYGEDFYVVAIKENGDMVKYHIKDGAMRWD